MPVLTVAYDESQKPTHSQNENSSSLDMINFIIKKNCIPSRETIFLGVGLTWQDSQSNEFEDYRFNYPFSPI